jgi:hypothetical protein
MQDQFSALECQIGDEHMLIAVATIEALGDYAAGAALPWTGAFQYSIAQWQSKPLLSVRLMRLAEMPMASRRDVTGVLLLNRNNHSMQWSIEITRSVGMVEVAAMAAASSASRWRRSATLVDGRICDFLDVDVLVQAGRV